MKNIRVETSLKIIVGGSVRTAWSGILELSEILEPGGGGTGGTTDPLWDDVLLLLHMDGSAGSTTFTDSGPDNRSVTASNASLQTSVVKFGTAAGSFDDSTLIVSSIDLALSGDVTIEGWMYATNDLSGYNTLLSTDTTEVHRIYVVNGGLALRYNSVEQITHQTTVTNNTWHHFAAVRKSGVWRLYLNGVQSTGSWSDNQTLTSSWRIGWDTFSGQDWEGHLDEWRITAAARYDGTFTAPTAAFPEG